MFLSFFNAFRFSIEIFASINKTEMTFWTLLKVSRISETAVWPNCKLNNMLNGDRVFVSSMQIHFGTQTQIQAHIHTAGRVCVEAYTSSESHKAVSYAQKRNISGTQTRYRYHHGPYLPFAYDNMQILSNIIFCI